MEIKALLGSRVDIEVTSGLEKSRNDTTEKTHTRSYQKYYEQNDLTAFPKNSDAYYYGKLAFAADKFTDAIEYAC